MAEPDWARLYVQSIERTSDLVLNIFRTAAETASLSDVIDYVADWADNIDLVDDESIAAYKAAKQAAQGDECPKLDAAPGRGECRKKVSVEAGRCILNDGHDGNCKGEFVGPGGSP